MALAVRLKGEAVRVRGSGGVGVTNAKNGSDMQSSSGHSQLWIRRRQAFRVCTIWFWMMVFLVRRGRT